MVAPVPKANWAALDLREAAYARHDVTDKVVSAAGEVQVYIVPPSSASTPPRPILLSYLDAVIQGFHQLFGQEGVARFFDTTDGWETEILDDRARPHYPRAQRLRPVQRALVDLHIEERGLRRIAA